MMTIEKWIFEAEKSIAKIARQELTKDDPLWEVFIERNEHKVVLVNKEGDKTLLTTIASLEAKSKTKAKISYFNSDGWSSINNKNVYKTFFTKDDPEEAGKFLIKEPEFFRNYTILKDSAEIIDPYMQKVIIKSGITSVYLREETRWKNEYYNKNVFYLDPEKIKQDLCNNMQSLLDPLEFKIAMNMFEDGNFYIGNVFA